MTAADFVTRKSCPACRSTSGEVVVDLPYTEPPLSDYLTAFYGDAAAGQLGPIPSGRYRLLRCADCETTYQATVPPAAWLARFYALIQEPDESTWPTFLFEQQSREVAMLARALDEQGLPKKALDYGVGTGAWARLARAAGFDVTGMDVAEGSFARLAAEGIRCVTPFSVPDADFSLIHAEQVFEHLAFPDDVLRELTARLRPRGLVAIGVPHDPDLPEKLRTPDWLAPKTSPRSLNAVAPLEHLNAFSPAGLRRLAETNGLVPLDVRGWQLQHGAAAAVTVRDRLGSWLRQRLGDWYRPAWSLTQTVFWQKPAAPGI